MRFSRLFGSSDRKQLSARPLGSRSVHPTGGGPNGGEGCLADARLAKLVGLLGAQTPSERFEIFLRINNCQTQEQRKSVDSATSCAFRDHCEGEESEEEQEEQQEVDVITRFGFLQSHSPAASRCSHGQAFATTLPRPASVIPLSPRAASAEELRSSGSSQPASDRGIQSLASEGSSLSPRSPERHYLPSPQRASDQEPSPKGHRLPAPPSPLSKHATSAASSKHRSSSSRNSAARQPLFPPASPPPGFTQSSKHVLQRVVTDSAKMSDKVGQKSQSWTSGPSLYKSLSQAVEQSISNQRPHSKTSASAGEFSTTPLQCPCPPLSTPQQSPPGSPSRIHGLYRLVEPPISEKTPFRGPIRSSKPSPPPITTHFQQYCDQSSPYTPPLSPVSPSQLSWSQVPRCPRKWKIGAKLGQGTFGVVYEGWNQEDGSFFAVKISSREGSCPEIQREVAVLGRLEHPNIVRYLGSSVEDGHLCIFLELVRMGSLESVMKKYSRLINDSTIRTYTRQILHGLEYLHERKTIHRDIKCSNILVDVNGRVKLADFGVAKEVEESLACSIKGTPLYMAPEVLTAHGTNYSFPADIWSLGCTVIEMAAGQPPWSDLHGFGFYFKVKNGELPSIPDLMSPEGKDFVLKCLRFEPLDRPTAKELLQHPFVANVPTPEDVISWSCLYSPPVSPGPWANPSCPPPLFQGKLL